MNTKLVTEEEKARQRENVRQMDANNAIEGLHVDADGKAVLDEIIECGLSHEEGMERVIQSLKDRGIIPADKDETPTAAE